MTDLKPCPFCGKTSCLELDYIAEDIENAPAADVAPVRHGQAFYLDDFANAGWYCDQCHKKHPKKPKFCSNCGAKLDLEAQHE